MIRKHRIRPASAGHPLLLLLLLATPAFVNQQTDRTDRFIQAEIRRQNIPGLSLAIVKDGKIIKTGGYGFANIAEKIPAAPETVYKIASVSKQFIAAGVMLLVQEGRIQVTDSVTKYIEDAPETWSGITIRHLLSHTSGLAREAPGFDPRKAQSDADVIRTAYRLPLRFAPGERWDYSNLGYFVAAELIRQVSGRPWTEYLAQRIFTPLGMTSTYPTNTQRAVPHKARGYVDNDELRDAAEWVALRPSGAFISTVLDLAKWDAALHTDTILSEPIRQQMLTAVELNDGTTAPHGYGWILATVNGHRLVHHPGGMPGARANVARFVDQRLTIIVLMNLDDVDIDAIVMGLSELYLPAAAGGQ